MKKLIATLLIGLLLASPVMALNTEQILNKAYDSTSNSLRLSLSSSDSKDATALTNTVTYPMAVTHETSGTAAAGIGVGYEYIQDTAASGSTNDETVAATAAVMTDVTSTSEDADLVVYLMKAGAAIAEAFRVTSTGVLTLVNGEKIDNATTNGTIAFVGAAIDVQGGNITLENDGVIDNSSNTLIKVDEPNAATNTVTNIFKIGNSTSGTAANGMGTRVSWEHENDGGTAKVALTVDAVSTDVTAASEDDDMVVSLIDAGSLAERFRLTSDGVVTLLNAGVIDNTSNGVIKVDEPSAATNTVVNILKVGHSTSGTAAAGIGTRVNFEHENDAGAAKVVLALDAVSTDVTAASEDDDLVISLIDAGSLSERMRIDSDGVLTFRNAETIDNGTNGTLNFTASTIKHTMGTTGGWNMIAYEATSGALSGASGSIAVNMPSGARVIGCQLRVDTEVTFGGGGATWGAIFATGSTATICANTTSGAKSTKCGGFFNTNGATDILTGTTTITVAPNAGTFSAGNIRAICYAESFTAMADAP